MASGTHYANTLNWELAVGIRNACAECFWALLMQWTLDWLQFFKKNLWSQHLTKKYIFPSNSEQLLLKGLGKTCFWDIPWKMTILLSLRFHATIVPHLTASVGTGDRWKSASCASFYYSLGISGWSWIQATVPWAEDDWGKKHLRTSTQSRWLLDGNAMGNGLQNVWCLSGTMKEYSG